ncbi:hypothetical protein SAMN05216474_2129 [Lishizhenia tianjinensis]|uniref:Uncharacterized protein n=1 Tax=Lishizhenia tianjinensis TaxID=477690 RepID=A0A1I7AIN0_9FLAO|nr:hypothetical protein SAMN05216474_2129 [Lishizhenia tianjinensis]
MNSRLFAFIGSNIGFGSNFSKEFEELISSSHVMQDYEHILRLIKGGNISI